MFIWDRDDEDDDYLPPPGHIDDNDEDKDDDKYDHECVYLDPPRHINKEDEDDDNYDHKGDYLHPPRHIVPFCTIGDSTGEIVTRSASKNMLIKCYIQYKIKLCYQ